MSDTLSTTPPRPAGFPRGHAIVIGITAYDDARLTLPRAVSDDARDVAALLASPSCGYDPADVQLLLDGDASLARIRSALAGIATRAALDDTVIVFFSGHGAQLPDGSALVPADADLRHPEATLLFDTELSNALERIPSRRLLVMIDACHAAGAARFKAGYSGDSPPLGFSTKALTGLAEGSGRVLIASCRESETSVVLGGARNSLFTEHLLGALRGRARTRGDGLVRVFETFNYVAERVRAAAPGQQHPVMKTSVEDDFPVALSPGQLKGTSEAHAPRELADILADLYPDGPNDDDIWTRAGGDPSRLRRGATGRSSWAMAVRTLRQGGGGSGITVASLTEAVMTDFPRHPALAAGGITT